VEIVEEKEEKTASVGFVCLSVCIARVNVDLLRVQLMSVSRVLMSVSCVFGCLCSYVIFIKF